MNTDYLFVYGSLRKQAAPSMDRLLARHCEFLSEGHMYGKLYVIDGYPGAIESANENDKVYGEVYSLASPDRVLPELDEYEECSCSFPHPHEYVRRTISISLSCGGNLLAWTYLYNRDTSLLEEIKSGDFLRYLKKNSS